MSDVGRWAVRHPGIGILYYDSEQEARAAAGTAGEFLGQRLAPAPTTPAELVAEIVKAEEDGHFTRSLDVLWPRLLAAIASLSRDQLEARYAQLLVDRAGGRAVLASGPAHTFREQAHG